MQAKGSVGEMTACCLVMIVRRLPGSGGGGTAVTTSLRETCLLHGVCPKPEGPCIFLKCEKDPQPGSQHAFFTSGKVKEIWIEFRKRQIPRPSKVYQD